VTRGFEVVTVHHNVECVKLPVHHSGVSSYVCHVAQENMYGECVYHQNTTEYRWYNLVSKAQLHVLAAVCWPS
jgi:hypothetical protein